VNRYLSKGHKSKSQFKTKWREIINEMIRFSPELVIISAGFDAHSADPLADCELDEEDFEWATMIVIDACKQLNPLSPVRCISVLEGGYDLPAITSSALAHVQTMFDYTAEAHEAAAAESGVVAEAGELGDVGIRDASTERIGVEVEDGEIANIVVSFASLNQQVSTDQVGGDSTAKSSDEESPARIGQDSGDGLGDSQLGLPQGP
jgi:Histone deacetylase domain